MNSYFRLSSHVESPDSFWTVDLVPTDRHQVYVVSIDVYWNFTDRLGGISMEKDLFRPAQLANLCDWLHNADFVVDVDD